MNKSILSGNIIHLRSLNQQSQQEVADGLQFKHKSKYGAYEDGRAEPPIDILRQLSEYFEVPIDLLVNKNLTSLSKQGYWNLKENYYQKAVPLQELGQQNRIIVAPDAHHAKAGLPVGQFDDDAENLNTITLPHNPNGVAIAFPIIGDSMPPLDDGDYVVGEKKEFKDLRDGKTYIIRFQEDDGAPFESVYKIVYNKVKEDGTLHLLSTNPNYSEIKLEASKVKEIYAYFCHLSYNEPSNNEYSMNDISNMIKNMSDKLDHIK